VESPPNTKCLLGFQTGDKSIQETLNLTLKVVHNSPETRLIHRATACYPQRAAGMAGEADRDRAIRPDGAGDACANNLNEKASPEGGL
jgi:hypothetical protein